MAISTHFHIPFIVHIGRSTWVLIPIKVMPSFKEVTLPRFFVNHKNNIYMYIYINFFFLEGGGGISVYLC